MNVAPKKTKKSIWNAPVGELACRVLIKLASKIHKGYADHALLEVLRREPDALRSFIADRASEIAVGVTMVMLDREGLSHCHRCPQRFGLRKVGGRYACLKHYEEEKALKPA